MKTHHRGVIVVTAALLLVVPTMLVPMLAITRGGALATTAASADIPSRVLAAYEMSDGWCSGLRWQLIAAIGRVESRHGTAGGASAGDKSGEVTPWIFGIPLDGTDGTLRMPIGQWLGWWGLQGPWEQAVGPMQFLASTFEGWAVDADADGRANPHDIDDAAVTAANFLCGGPDGSIGDERAAVLRYNNSAEYADEVLALADELASPAILVGGGWLCPVAGPVSFADTWGAPRSGGRAHQGVDMFAARGTPMVAPVKGTVERRTGGIGGFAVILWGDDGNYYYGAHLSAFGVGIGQVTAGAILGYVGDSGNAAGTPPHLHFEIHPGRARDDQPAPANPTPAVTAACEGHRLGVTFESDS